MTTQTIEVKFELLNTLASQLRAAGAAIKVAKGNDTFKINITKQPSLATIEEILTYSAPNDNSDLIESIAIPPEEVKDFTITEEIISTLVETIDLSDAVKVPAEESTDIPAKRGRNNSTKSKQRVENSSAFADDNDIPF